MKKFIETVALRASMLFSSFSEYKAWKSYSSFSELKIFHQVCISGSDSFRSIQHQYFLNIITPCCHLVPAADLLFSLLFTASQNDKIMEVHENILNFRDREIYELVINNVNILNV